MKSYKELLNEWAQVTDVLHEITDEERHALQSTLLEMYKDIDKLCNDNGIVAMLGGGSCIGAIRHKGFIPWDDDLDLMMGRPDYNKLLDLLKAGALSDKYEFRYPDGKMETRCAFLQIFKKGTVALSFGQDRSDIPQGVFIDVFPIEGAPKNWLWRKCKGYISNALRLISNCIDDSNSSPSTIQAYKEKPELYRLMKKRIILGKLFRGIGSKRLRYWLDRFVRDENLTGLTCVPTSRKLYGGEIQDCSFKFPAILVPFEDYMAKVPQNYDKYLTDMYGDYMQLPPIEKRERHFYIKLKL